MLHVIGLIGFSVTVIALGNGTACRETETVISTAIASGAFLPQDVQYTIVNEDGSSVYSVSDIAAQELPSLDQNLRSAGISSGSQKLCSQILTLHDGK